mgnify:FL=1
MIFYTEVNGIWEQEIVEYMKEETKEESEEETGDDTDEESEEETDGTSETYEETDEELCMTGLDECHYRPKSTETGERMRRNEQEETEID